MDTPELFFRWFSLSGKALCHHAALDPSLTVFIAKNFGVGSVGVIRATIVNWLHSQEYIYRVPISQGLAKPYGLLQAQKNPPGFHLAGFQDFVSGSGDHQQRILVGWRSLNWLCNLLFNS